MLLETLARLVENIRRDDEDAAGAGEGPFERGRIVEIGSTGLDTLRRIACQFGGVPAGGDDIGRLRFSGFQKRIEYELAKLAGRSGNEQFLRHVLPFASIQPVRHAPEA